MNKNIPPPLDVIGRNICFRLNKNGIFLNGEVIKVWFEHAQHPDYPGKQNRVLRKKLKVVLPDGRVLRISGEHEDLKRMDAIAEL